jgi:cellulose biosynthesis protein BcsQ
MIPAGIRLYSWIDVEDVLLRTLEEGEWPDWLLSARAYWDGLVLGVEPGQDGEVLPWLAERFAPRFRNGDSPTIELESIPTRERLLPILIEEMTDSPVEPRFTPTLARPSVLRKPAAEPVHPDPLPTDLPPVVAFHSFKGGVGRTLHALALALSLIRRGKDTKVLLVDGDLEAPGLTWLFQERFPQLPVSLLDLLALAHGDSDPKSEDSIALVASRVREIHLDGIFGLPAFRALGQLSSIEVRPEHLVQGAHDPFILTSVLGRLGQQLGVDVVIVDLRAGFSEISAGLLLDPRVHRVLVSTLSSQSLEGTRQILEYLGARSPSRTEEEPLPTLILSQIPEAQFRNDLALLQAEETLIEAARSFLPESEEITGALLDIVPITTPFDPRFVILPGSWGEVLRMLDQSEIPQRLVRLVEKLPLTSSLLEPQTETAVNELWTYRNALQSFAGKLIFAETGDIQDFLSIVPLRNLAADFSNRPPVAVVIGSKGAGKTYTFLQAVYRGTWSRFVRDIGELSTTYEASLCPVLQSSNLSEHARHRVENALQATARSLGLSSPQTETVVRDYIRNGLRQDLHEGEWRERWLNAIAWRLGFEVASEDAGARLPDHLRHTKTSAVAIIDGLEDLFQSLIALPSQQTALRSLLQDVPAWLEQQPLRPLGIVVFVRRDMVLSAVKQNHAQLMAQYEQYALKWGPDEALRLVSWTAVRAGALPGVSINDWEKAERTRLVDELSPLWGRKLGSERSKEANSADWVIAALSDLKGQIQARDLVRFLHEAAKASLVDNYWKDRVLVPKAMREAVGQCSQAKIDEIGQENPEVNEIFNKLQSLPADARQIPFTREQVERSVEEMKTLEDNGAVLREGEEYYMPEIFRLGLGFKLPRGARPRVLTLARGRK